MNGHDLAERTHPAEAAVGVRLWECRTCGRRAAQCPDGTFGTAVTEPCPRVWRLAEVQQLSRTTRAVLAVLAVWHARQRRRRVAAVVRRFAR